MDLKKGNFKQLTDGEKIKATGAVVSPKNMQVYYFQDKNLITLDIKTLKEKVIYSIPKNFNPAASLSIDENGTTIAFAIVEKTKTKKKEDKHFSDANDRFNLYPESSIILVKTDGSGGKIIYTEKKWLSHVVVNPKNPNIILYCQEGPWSSVPQRMWTINADGSDNRPLRVEEKPELCIGHEFWFKDGLHIGYQVYYKGQDKQIGICDYNTRAFNEYSAGKNSHNQANSDGSLFVGDGSRKEPYLNIYKLINNKMVKKVLFHHEGSFDQEYFHPHPSFSPDDKSILFSSTKDGSTNIYLIFVDKLSFY